MTSFMTLVNSISMIIAGTIFTELHTQLNEVQYHVSLVHDEYEFLGFE